MIVEIDGRRIGAGEPPYLVAELSGNHNGKLGRALELVEAAHAAVRARVPFREADTTFTADIVACTELVRSGALVRAVEDEIGGLR